MNYVDFTNGLHLLENNLLLISCFPLQVSSGMFAAVAYSNCDCFFLGRVLKAEDGIFSITFLEQIDGKNGVFDRPAQATVQTVDTEQVFITDLEAEEAGTNRLTFPRIREVQEAFPQCKEALVKRLKISQVITII